MESSIAKLVAKDSIEKPTQKRLSILQLAEAVALCNVLRGVPSRGMNHT